ncbi:MAG TPA: TMEM175 family protein [Trueperaceae bacterium]|nr:TMEM175 family protein [Trueperaceae bacterium]
MGKSRMEAFSDGVIAIIITVMVLELTVPSGASWAALRQTVPALLTYVLSFSYLAIYWNNHHHMLHAIERVDGAALWANLHLLFWLSLVPFVTAWMGQNHFAAAPTTAYGAVLLLAAIAYHVLQQRLMVANGPGSRLRAAIGRDLKGRLSPMLYLIAIAAALLGARWLSYAVYVAVALIWLVPDRRIESTLAD